MYGSQGVKTFRPAFDGEEQWNFFKAEIEKQGFVNFEDKFNKEAIGASSIGEKSKN